jgi:hypothetical protein
MDIFLVMRTATVSLEMSALPKSRKELFHILPSFVRHGRAGVPVPTQSDAKAKAASFSLTADC